MERGGSSRVSFINETFRYCQLSRSSCLIRFYLLTIVTLPIEYPKQVIRCVVCCVEQYQGRTVRFAVAPLPMAKRSEAYTESCCKLVLSQPGFFSYGFYIYRLRSKQPDTCLLSSAMRYRLFQSQFYALKESTHIIFLSAEPAKSQPEW